MFRFAGLFGLPSARSWKIRRVEGMAFEISCPTCTSLGTELTIAGAMKLALAHAPQHSPVYIAGDGPGSPSATTASRPLRYGSTMLCPTSTTWSDAGTNPEPVPPAHGRTAGILLARETVISK